MKRLEAMLVETEHTLKKTTETLVSHIGKVIALLTLIIAAVLTFAEVTFADLSTSGILSTLAILLIAALVMYCAMEQEGESFGMEGEAYQSLCREIEEHSSRVKGEMLPALRSYLDQYTKEECTARRMRFLLVHGFTSEDLERYHQGVNYGKRAVRIFRACERITPVKLSPGTLLCGCSDREDHLVSPERRKHFRMLARLIPSLICMSVTVSVIVEIKSGITAASIAEGIIKLSALLSVGLRGYLSGYRYVKGPLMGFQLTRCKLLDGFLNKG